MPEPLPSESQISTLTDLLGHRERTTPDRTAYTFLADGENASAHLTNAGLAARGRIIAGQVAAQTVPGDRALLLYSPGLGFMEAFFGCLFAGVIAVPSYPPKRNRPDPRLATIVSDSGAKLVLTDSAILGEIEPRLENTPSLRALTWMATDAPTDERTTKFASLPEVSPEDLAFLQYTSGSTADPKGVMVSHANLLHNLADLDRGWDHQTDSVMVTWLPIFHDMGLIYGALMPLFKGFSCVMMPPAAFLQRPVRWLEAISRFKGTHSAAPNFAYDLCVASTTEESRQRLDLSTWRFSLNAAEPVRAHTLDLFNAAFTPRGLSPQTVKPGFGLAEATLKVTALPRAEPVSVEHLDADALARHELRPLGPDDPKTTHIVGCGWGQVDNHTMIVDPDSRQPCPADRVGEIWFSGPSVAQGYWQRPQASEETFRATLADGSGPWMRTGDLGFMKGRELFVTGRIKDLVIIRGLNHYPQDIELTAEQAHASIRSSCSAAFAIDTEQGEALAIVAEVERTSLRRFNEAEVVAAIREAVATQHEVAVHTLVFIKPAAIPKTSSGKIQRSLARQRLLNDELKPVASWSASSPVGKPSAPSGDDLEQVIIENMARILKVDATTIDASAPFAAHGLESLAAVELSGTLQSHLGRPLNPTLAYDFPSVRALAQHLADQVGSQSPPSAETASAEDDAIAIIGMGCRFPGATSIDEFWDLLISGRDAIGPIPSDRWDASQFTAPPRGGFLSQVDQFDAEFFGLSAREADLIDPQQRLLLETTWEALEHAGIAPDQIGGSATGVFVGISMHDYLLLQARQPGGLSPYAGTGNALSVAANRISYTLDLRGPSMAIDTACSSSLVALHHAVRSLRQGESDLAVAGGVNLMLAPDLSESFAGAGMLSPDGQCKTFDASANGYVRGEGAGMVALKRLSTAQRDGNQILAILRGSAINQDGRSNGLTAPNGPAQQAVIKAAWRDAGVSASQISFVESHGTGTSLGDPIELNALHAVLTAERTADAPPCVVGAVKSQVGHLEAAAGIVGLIKTVLALHHGKIPANLHCQNINPHLAEAAAALKLPAEPITWDAPQRWAGVSSFGFGGANSHVVLATTPVESGSAVSPSPEPRRPVESYVLSARDPAALNQMIEQHHKFLKTLPQELWPDAAYTTTVGRPQFDHRVAIVAPDTANATELLRSVERVSPPAQAPRIGFLFSGQGSLYVEAGRELRESCPAFNQALKDCRNLIQDIAGWDVIEASDDPTKVGQTEYAQVSLFALEYSLARTWQSWGIQPTAVAGHSVGEYAAAVIAGVMDLASALRLLITRARLMGALGETGAMAAIRAPAAEVEVLARSCGAEIGAYNSARQTVITGSATAVATTCQAAEKAGFSAATLSVKQGYHSAEMEPMMPDFRTAAEATKLSPAKLIFVSSQTGQAAADAIATANYWVDQIRSPVRWEAAVQTLAQTGCELIIEVGPRNLLSVLSAQSWPDQSVDWLTSLQPSAPDWTTLLQAATRAWVAGAPLSWSAVQTGHHRTRVALPTYPFQRRRHWFSDTAVDVAPRRPSESGHRQVPTGCSYTLTWEPQPLEASRATAAPVDWLIVGEDADLASWLTAAGHNVDELTEFKPGAWQRVVHLVGSGSADQECQRALQTLQGVAASESSPRLHIVTRGVIAVTADEARAIQLPGSAVWGMGLSFALKHPEQWGGLIDLSSRDDEDQGSVLADELSAGSDEDQIALRTERYVARVTPREIPTADPIELSADATYWITGGMGAIGRQTARWLIEQGAHRLVLSGRSEIDATGEAAINELQSLGAEVAYLAMDVTNPTAVGAFLDDVETAGHPVRGIIHAAGVKLNEPLAKVTPESMAKVLHPKVEGGRVLHESTIARDLDFLVFFSSIASVWGSEVQLQYSAANRYLDALASLRHGSGLAATTLNWGPWAGGGMAGREEQDLLERMGITALDSATHLSFLGAALAAGQAQNVIARVDWDRLRGLIEMQRPKPLLSELGSSTDPSAAAVNIGPTALVGEWTDMENEARTPVIVAWLQAELADLLGRASGRLPDPKDGFFDLGIDSLLAMEFRNRLVKALGLPLPATLAFDHNNINALTAFLIAKLWSEPQANPPPAQPPTPSTLPPTVKDGATAAEIDAALDARLARLEALTRDD